jgi:hypothetical protein
MSSNNQQDQEYASSSDSESCVEIVPADSDLPKCESSEPAVNLPASVAPELEADFWMVTRQTQCGATLSERMMAFMKALNAAQTEFAEKLAAISAGELARAKPAAEEAAIYQEYWVQLQLAMRLCRTWSQSNKEMSAAIGQLIQPMDRIVHNGRARLKDSAIWNVELNKALSIFHTNIAKRQAKCYKALSVVMTPEYFDQTPARKGHAVRRAAPTVSKYVEQIDEANAWLTKYMAQRPGLKSKLEGLESKRIEITRSALTTFASQVKTMGTVMTDLATEIITGVANIDDSVCRSVFINTCRQMPTPHLERPALFEYTLPVPISELGIRPVRDPRPVRQHMESLRRDEPVRESHISSVSATPRNANGNRDDAALGKRISSFATLIFGGQQQQQQQQQPQPQQNRPVQVSSARSSPAEPEREEHFEEENDDEVVNAARPNEEQITRFGNIIVRNEQSDVSNLDKTMMKTVRRTAAVANINDIDRSFANAAPSA